MVFLFVLGEGMEGAFLKECEAANRPFPPRIVNKIWQGCRYGCEGWCCKNNLSSNNFYRRTRVLNTGSLVAFLLVLGEGVEGAFLKECEAANRPFPPRVVNKLRQGRRYGSEGWCCKNDLDIPYY